MHYLFKLCSWYGKTQFWLSRFKSFDPNSKFKDEEEKLNLFKGLKNQFKNSKDKRMTFVDMIELLVNRLLEERRSL